MGYAFENDGNTQRWFPHLKFASSIADLFNGLDPERFASIVAHATKRWGNYSEVRIIPEDLSLLQQHLVATDVVKCAVTQSHTLIVYDVKGLSDSFTGSRSKRPYKYPATFDSSHFEKIMEALWGRHDLDLEIRNRLSVFGKGGGDLL